MKTVKTLLLTPVSRRAGKEYLYAIVSGVLGFLGFFYTFLVLSFGTLLAVTLVGLPIIAFGLYGARLLGGVQRRLASSLLGADIAAPPPVKRPRGILPRLGAALSDGPGWRALAYQLVRTPLAVAYGVVLFSVMLMGVLYLTYPLGWWLLKPSTVDAHGVRHHSAFQIDDIYADTLPRALLVSLCGVVLLLVVPWLIRVIVFLDQLLMHGLLGPTRAEQRIVDLTESRSHAVDDSAAALRRIERDLHDGAQAQLVALAMQLGEARENLDAPRDAVDLVETRALIETAHRNAKQAINELRDLARGIHPPALDNGLADALGTLASRTPLPVTVRVHLLDRPSAAVETIAYFCTAELLTNATKHSKAKHAQVEVKQTREGRLRLRVTDDGLGGAAIRPGGGLAGLLDRVGTVDGTIAVTSPAGGPTTVVVDLPIRS